MVKISEGKYKCDWCGEDISWTKTVGGKAASLSPDVRSVCKGKKRVAAQLRCPKCNRYVSQRRSYESK